MNAPLIELTGLSKRYRDFWHRARIEALRDLTLDVRQGEVFGLLGPNGSGKTTTIKLLLGLIAPTAGTVRVFGAPPGDVKARSRLGFLPEESSLHRFLTCEETLRFYGKLFNLPRAVLDTRIDQLFTLVDMQHARKRKLKACSKGMVRRIGLAQALINEPELLILDEPTSGLDPMGTAEVKRLIRRLSGEGKTVLLASHQLADVQDLCDRVAILHRGRLVSQGAVSDLVREADQLRLVLSGASSPDDSRLAGIREAIARAGLSLERVEAESRSLEAVFLEVIGQSPPPP